MRTKVVSFFIFFQDLSNKQKKIKKLRPKMAKIASGGGGGAALKLLIEQANSVQVFILRMTEQGANLHPGNQQHQLKCQSFLFVFTASFMDA